jgi:hypothetical protein
VAPTENGGARATLDRLRREKEAREKTHPREEQRKDAPSVSLTGPEARRMRFPDGAVRAGYNLQTAAVPEQGLIVAVLATDRRKLIEPIHAHYKDRGLGRLSARGLIKPKRWRSGMRSPTISWSAIGSGRRPRPPRAEITRRATATTPSTPPDLPNASIHPSPAKARILNTLESGGLDVLRREQALSARPVMRPPHASSATSSGGSISKKRNRSRPPQIAPQYHTAGDVNPMQRKHRLGPVDGNARNLGHGRSPVRVSTTELWHQMPRGRPPQRNSAAPSAFLPASGLDDPY